MSSLDLVDETYLVTGRPLLAAVVSDKDRWQQWWPELTLSVFMDRGVDGIRWSISGALVGSSEIWLEPVGDGVLLHYYLRAEPNPPDRRKIDRLRSRHAMAWKRSVWALKDELEGDRRPGDPR